MDCCGNRVTAYSRREMLSLLGCGFGSLALMAMLGRRAIAGGPVSGAGLGLAGSALGLGEGSALAPKSPMFAARAKRVIFLCMSGGPSHVDTFDYKPALAKNDGREVNGRGVRQAKLLGSPFKFTQHGKSGLWISELFPSVANHADSLCLMHGMRTDVPAHAQAFLKMHTGSFQFVRPSLGAWTLYGLGTENQDLPGFITIGPPSANGGAQNFGAGFLPAIYQGTPIAGAARNRGRRGGPSDASLPNIANGELSKEAQRKQLDLVQKLNREHARRSGATEEVDAVIESFELAFRMQAEVPELMDLAGEKKETLDLYGIGGEGTDRFGRQCLLARRMAERGVRFIEVGHGGWDMHRNLRADLTEKCGEIDRPIAGLLTDLKRRGMLDDTLVVWGGEFGRTPYAQGDDGRDHNNKGFTMWMAGGGVKGGFDYGSTDETGAEAVDGRMDMHDWHATLLHLLGLDHERLTFNHAGRDFRLTDVHGRVAKEILA